MVERSLPVPDAAVEVEGTRFKILARIDGAKFENLKVGEFAEPTAHRPAGGRVFYRYRPA